VLPGLAYGLALAVRPAKYAAFRPRPVLTEEATGEGGRGVGRGSSSGSGRWGVAENRDVGRAPPVNQYGYCCVPVPAAFFRLNRLAINGVHVHCRGN